MHKLKAGVFVLGSMALLVVGAQAVRSFKPPATAVVDIAEVFEQYEKKKDRQAEFQAEIKGVEDKLKDIEKKYKDVVQELPQVEAGPRKNDLMLQKLKLEMEVKDLKEKEMDRLRGTQLKFLEEIRNEITQEIRAYADAENLDLVLEKTVTAESGDGNQRMGFRWPIVHFVKPELEITKEIAERLNAHYKKAR